VFLARSHGNPADKRLPLDEAEIGSFPPLCLPAHRPRPLLARCGQARPFRRDDEVEIEAERGHVDEVERRTHEHDGEEGLGVAMEEKEGHRRSAERVCAGEESVGAAREKKGRRRLAELHSSDQRR